LQIVILVYRKIIPGDLKAPGEEMSSQTEAKWVDRTFNSIGFVSSKVYTP